MAHSSISSVFSTILAYMDKVIVVIVVNNLLVRVSRLKCSVTVGMMFLELEMQRTKKSMARVPPLVNPKNDKKGQERMIKEQGRTLCMRAARPR